MHHTHVHIFNWRTAWNALPETDVDMK